MFSELRHIQKLGFRKIVAQLLAFITIVFSAFMMWKSFAWYTNTESPIVVVLTGSMSPAFERGDLLFLSLNSKPLEIGEIVVYQLPGREIPIVHRVIKIHANNETNEEYILTKGDRNDVNDRGLYNPNQIWLERKHIIAKVYGHLPYLGMITIILNNNPKLKVVLLLFMAIYVLSSNEEKK